MELSIKLDGLNPREMLPDRAAEERLTTRPPHPSEVKQPERLIHRSSLAARHCPSAFTGTRANTGRHARRRIINPTGSDPKRPGTSFTSRSRRGIPNRPDRSTRHATRADTGHARTSTGPNRTGYGATKRTSEITEPGDTRTIASRTAAA